MYDIRPDLLGWTVYEVELGRPHLLNEVALVGLEQAVADELVSLLNRTVYQPCPKRRALHKATLQPVVSRPHRHQHQSRHQTTLNQTAASRWHCVHP